MTGTIVTRTLANGAKRYDCVYRAGGKQRWKTFNRRKDAERFLTNTVKDVQDGTYIHVRPLLMGDLFDRWLTHSLDVRAKQGLIKPSTAKSYRSMLDTHLRPAFKDCRSDRLSAETVNDWVRARANEIADGTMAPKFFNNLVNLLSSILGWARGRGQRFLAHNPLEEVARLPRVRIERRYLEPAQLDQLVAAAESPRDTAILYLFAFSGVRRGELFGLRWADLDEAAAQLRVRRSIYQGDVTRPKTAHSERTVDLPARIVARLQAYRTTHPPLAGDYIFRTDTGAPLDPDTWFKASFIPTAVRAKLRSETTPDAGDEQLVGLHTLRHTYASLLINQGESIKYVATQLGHASIQITADLYGHLFKETSVSAMHRLSLRIPVTEATTDEAAGAA